MIRQNVLEKMVIYRGDIVKLGVDAIVNAANPSLLGGGGVDGAIHRAAGKELLAECYTLHGCAVGQAKITDAYALPALKIIHTVGPIWQGGRANEKELLRSCYWQSLSLAEAHRLTTVAFPAISTGAYGYPPQEAALIACQTVAQYLSEHSFIHKVYLVAFDFNTEKIYKSALAQLAAASKETANSQNQP